MAKTLAKPSQLSYRVGALMYSPALNTSIADKLVSGDEDMFQYLDSLVFCLEDAITEAGVAEAQKALQNSLAQIHSAAGSGEYPNAFSPLLFVRVRSPKQLSQILSDLRESAEVLTGFVMPKFDMLNAAEYIAILQNVNRIRKKPFYMMPIIETPAVMHIERRSEELLRLREQLERIQEYVLNVRVGGNDFCGLYGLRRGAGHTIYDIGLVRDVLIDVLNVFARDFVVSAPVWEYFGGDEWRAGLKQELELDLLNGFIGKTAIHPLQLPIIRESLQVKRSDYEDALNIVNWNEEKLGVAGSCDDSRMNEVAVHKRWADKIVTLAEIYGIKD